MFDFSKIHGQQKHNNIFIGVWQEVSVAGSLLDPTSECF